MPFVVEDSLTTYLRSWSRLLPCAEAGSSFSNVNENLRNKTPITITPNHPRHIPNLLQPPTHTLPNQNVHHKTKKDPHPCESGHLRTFRRNLPVVHGLQFEHGPLIGSKHQQKIVSMMTMRCWDDDDDDDLCYSSAGATLQQVWARTDASAQWRPQRTRTGHDGGRWGSHRPN